MNTRAYGTPMIQKGRDYIFCNEDLEPVFERSDLQEITKKWNIGYSLETIALKHGRDPDEVFLAIFHQARQGELTRKIRIANFEEDIGL